MANVKEIEWQGGIYNIADETARGEAQQARALADTAQSTANAAQNTANAARAEIAETASIVGDLENLTTTAKNNVVAALNELNAKSNPSAEWSQTAQGIDVKAIKSDHLVTLEANGTYTGETIKNLTMIVELPESLRPIRNARTALINNDSDVPQGQFFVSTDGRIELWGGAGDITNGTRYVAQVCYIVA